MTPDGRPARLRALRAHSTRQGHETELPNGMCIELSAPFHAPYEHLDPLGIPDRHDQNTALDELLH